MSNVVLKVLKETGHHSCVIISLVVMQIPFQKSCVLCNPLHLAHTSTMSANLILVYINEQAGDSPSDSCPPYKTLVYHSTLALVHLLNLLTSLAQRL